MISDIDLGIGWPSRFRSIASPKLWDMTPWIRPSCTLREPNKISKMKLRKLHGHDRQDLREHGRGSFAKGAVRIGLEQANCAPGVENMMANAQHMAMLRQGVKVWNAWREDDPEIEKC